MELQAVASQPAVAELVVLLKRVVVLRSCMVGGKRGTQMMRINEGPFALKVERSPHEMEMDRLRAMELQKMERKRKQLERSSGSNLKAKRNLSASKN